MPRRMPVPGVARMVLAAGFLLASIYSCAGSPAGFIAYGKQTGTAPPLEPTLAITDLPPVPLGQPSAKDGLVVTVYGIAAHETVGGFSPMAGNTYLVVDAQVENTGEDPFQVSFLFFGVMDAGGQSYYPPHSSPDFAPQPALDPTKIASGASIRGNVMFEVPSSVASGVITFMAERPGAHTWYRHQFTWKN